jgi:hypothetical protein
MASESDHSGACADPNGDLFPVTMSLISVGLMFLLILNPLFGAFDGICNRSASALLVMEWFGDYRIALYTLAVVSGWAFTGMPMILYFAGSATSQGNFDARQDRGRRHFRMLTQVAVPQLRPVTAVVVMLTCSIAARFRSRRCHDQGRSLQVHQRARLSRLSRELLEFPLRLWRDAVGRHPRHLHPHGHLRNEEADEGAFDV